MSPIVRGVVARTAALVPQAIATFVSSRVILDHYGVEVFNAFILVFSLMVLIPLNDLGAGAALTSAVASRGVGSRHTRRVALTAARTLALSGLGLATVALSLSAFDLWDEVVGDGAFGTAAFGIAIAAYGLSFVPGLGQSALLGVNKNDLTIVVQAFLAPTMCIGAVVAVRLDLDAGWVVVVPGLSVLVISLLNAEVSARVTKLRLLRLVPRIPRRKRYPGASIRGIAGPALIVMLTAPISLQSQRFVLSHFGTSQDVAEYSVAMQIFSPLLALIPAAARPLWPMFTQARATGVRPISLTKVILAFVTLAGLGGAALCVVSDPLAAAIGGERVELGIALPVAFALVAMLQAVATPLAMVLMYPAGLRLTATVSVIGTALNVVGSILVAPHLGAPGPLYAGLVVAVLVQTLPAILFVRRHGLAGPDGGAGAHREPDAGQPPPPPAPLAPLGGEGLSGPTGSGWAFQLLHPEEDPPPG